MRYDAEGNVTELAGIAAREIRAGAHKLSLNDGVFSGQLKGYDDSDPHNVLLHLSELVTDEVVGSYIIFDNREVADGSYRIESIVNERTVNIGQMPLYERLVNPNNFSAGVIYNLQAGEYYSIPRSIKWRRP